MRSKEEVKKGLERALRRTVNASFYKRGFVDEFNEEEMKQIREIDGFIKRVALYRGEELIMEERASFFFLCCRTTLKYYGKTICTFYNKAIPMKEVKGYEPIEYYVAKAIYRLIQKKNIEVFYAVNTFSSGFTMSGKCYPQRTNECVYQSNAVFCDIDLPEEMYDMSDEDVLELFMDGYEELFSASPLSLIVRSGGGMHLYYELSQTVNLQSKPMEELWKDTMDCLQKLLRAFGADSCCVDKSRILRLPNSMNRKEKYGEGKKVRVMYDSQLTYDLEELNRKLHFLLDGGMCSLFEEIGEELDELTFLEALQEDVFISADVSEEDDVFSQTEYREPSTEKLNTKPEREERPKGKSEMTTEEREEKKKENKKKLAQLVKKKQHDFEYQGISVDYNSLPKDFFQNRDIYFWILNRRKHEGLRHLIFFYLGFNWYYKLQIKDYDELCRRWRKVNEIINPKMEESELQERMESAYEWYKNNNRNNRCVRNSLIQQQLQFTDEEKEIITGNYYDNEEDRRNKLRAMERKYYRKYRDLSGKKPVKEKMEKVEQLFIDNPKLTIEEFKEKTGLKEHSYYRYRKRVFPKSKKEQFKEFFQEGEDISFEAFEKQFQMKKGTYDKYKRLFLDKK